MTPQPISRFHRRRPSGARLALMLVSVAAVVLSPIVAVASRARRDESGQESIIGPVAMGLLAILAAVAIWAVLRQLGLDIVNEMRTTLGL